MSRVLVAYEDTYFEEFDRTVRRVARVYAPTSAPRERCPVEGVTNFGNFVRRDWPIYRDKGVPVGKPRMERLVCVADADAVSSQLPGIPACPTAGPTEAWLDEAEAAFERYLKASAEEIRRLGIPQPRVAAQPSSQGAAALGQQVLEPGGQPAALDPNARIGEERVAEAGTLA